LLESTFKYAAVLRRMRLGPMGTEIDTIDTEFVRLGYAQATRRRYLSLIATFSRYAAARGHQLPEQVDRDLAERFVRQIRASAGTRSLARTATGHVLRHLGRLGPGRFRRDAESPDPMRHGRKDSIIAAFEAYLRDVRGLQPRSSSEILLHARRTLRWFRSRHPRRSLRALRGEDVLAFVAHLATTTCARATVSAAVSHLRGLLRFLHGQGVLRRDLVRVVPRVPHWEQSTVPRHLAWADVRATIDAIDARTPVGKRDRALLLLFATTGLRSQEVRRLELRDIDWCAGELHIRRTKPGRERLVPLVAEAGRALADYVLHGRPRRAPATVFLRHVAPAGPLRYSSTVAAIVRRRLKDRGYLLTSAGAHLLRHSLATRLVQQGRPIKEVADVMGHRRIDTTAIYIKVALPQLTRVALPFPGYDA